MTEVTYSKPRTSPGAVFLDQTVENTRRRLLPLVMKATATGTTIGLTIADLALGHPKLAVVCIVAAAIFGKSTKNELSSVMGNLTNLDLDLGERPASTNARQFRS